MRFFDVPSWENVIILYKIFFTKCPIISWQDRPAVVLTDVNTTAAAEGTQEAIDAVKAELENGTRHVFDCSTFTVSGANVKDTMKVDADGHLTSYMADVNTDEAYTGDTEVVHDGYFSESEFRSAPYFDLFIDGINTLDTAF